MMIFLNPLIYSKLRMSEVEPDLWAGLRGDQPLDTCGCTNRMVLLTLACDNRRVSARLQPKKLQSKPPLEPLLPGFWINILL